MKQGTGRHVTEVKSEPVSHAVNVEGVAHLGNMVGRAHSMELYSGRGFEAPVSNDTVHCCGSQGKR